MFQRFIFVSIFFVFFSVPGVSIATDTYYWLKPDKIVQYIQRGEGKRRVVFLYASWCPHCRVALPDIMDLAKKEPGSVIAISVDKKAKDLTDYMRKYSEVPFDMIVWNRSENLSLQLGRLGIELEKGIPFSALLDEKGRVYKQGYLSTKEISAYIQAG